MPRRRKFRRLLFGRNLLLQLLSIFLLSFCSCLTLLALISMSKEAALSVHLSLGVLSAELTVRFNSPDRCLIHLNVSLGLSIEVLVTLLLYLLKDLVGYLLPPLYKIRLIQVTPVLVILIGIGYNSLRNRRPAILGATFLPRLHIKELAIFALLLYLLLLALAIHLVKTSRDEAISDPVG